MTEQNIRRMVKQNADEAGSIRKLGLAWGLSAAYLSDVIAGKRRPGPSVLRRVGVVAKRIPARYTYEAA